MPVIEKKIMPRVDIKAILRNPVQRRRLMVNCIVATQAREGIKTTPLQTTPLQAAQAYAKVNDCEIDPMGEFCHQCGDYRHNFGLCPEPLPEVK